MGGLWLLRATAGDAASLPITHPKPHLAMNNRLRTGADKGNPTV